jgi:hypothetical protein
MTILNFDHTPEANFLNIVIGMHHGATVRTIAEKWPDFHWLIVESADEIDGAQQHLNDHALTHTTLCSIDELGAVIDQKYNTVLLNHSWVLLACDNMEERYQQLHWQVDTAVSSRATNVIAQHGIRKHVETGLRNVAENNLPASHFTSHVNGKDVLICAGGPSLDNQLPWIREHQDELVIISISRVARLLSDSGIAPHFIVLCDPFEYNFDVSADMFDIQTPAVLLYAWHACHLLVGNWTGPKAYMGRCIPDVLEDNVMATAPTVTNAALNFALLGQPQQIIFAGIDMCFTADGQSHCSGNMEATLPASIKHEDLKVKTMGGRQAFAKPYMVLAADALGEQITESDCQAPVYNLNPDALAIKGVETIASSQVKLGRTSFDVNAVIADVHDSEVITLADRKQSLKQFEFRIASIKKLAREALSRAKKIPKDDIQKEKLFARLSKSAAKIKGFDRTRHILTRAFGEEFSAALRGTDRSEMSVDEALDRVVRIHRGYYNSCKAVEAMCRESHERIALKEKELSASIGNDEIDQWIEIGIARRAESLSDTALRARCAEAFEEFRQHAREMRLKVFNSRGQKAPELMAQARCAYDEQDIDRLLIFLNFSQEQFEGTIKTQFGHWLQAMIYEFGGDDEQAILHHLAVVETSTEGLAESALLSLLRLTIKTGKHEDAINAAQVLADLNPTHLKLLEKTDRLLKQAA